jgi:N-acetylglutamate synthase-like GNAT family acetyltransferase
MTFQLCEAKKEDTPQLLNLYNHFTKTFVGSASRTLEDFRRFLRRKNNINWVAIDNQKRIVGYARAHFEKRLNRGEFAEIVVHPDYGFEQVAKPLAERIHNIFVGKKVLSITAGSVRNPEFEKIFPALGFFESESMGVFMYVILDVQKFLNEMQPTFANRLKQVEGRRILVQVECEGSSIFLQKTSENVEPLVFTSEPVDFKVTLSRDLLTKLVFGIADVVESLKAGQLQVATTLSQQKANRLLKTLFPKKQFLIMDYW